VRPFDGVNNVLMALPTRPFGNLKIMFLDSQRFRKTAGREREGVPEPIRCLRGVLAKEVRRCVAVVTNGRCPMAGLDPCVIVFLHYVTVGAGARVVRKIRPALGINERVDGDP
jgi:hypothetical protein